MKEKISDSVLAKHMAEANHCTVREADKALQMVLSGIANELAKENTVRLKNFGYFTAVKCPRRGSADLITNKKMEANPKVHVIFEAYETLKTVILPKEK